MPRQARRGAAWLRRGSSRRPWGWPGTCRSAPFVSYRRDSAEIVTCVLCRGQGEALTRVCRRVVEGGRGGGGGGGLRGRTRFCRRGRAAQPGEGPRCPRPFPARLSHGWGRWVRRCCNACGRNGGGARGAETRRAGRRPDGAAGLARRRS